MTELRSVRSFPLVTARQVAEVSRPRLKRVWLPPHTRLILASEDLLERFGSRNDEGYAITAEWCEQQPKGWYEPTFTVHYDQPLPALVKVEAELAEARDIINNLLMHMEPEWAEGIVDNYRRRGGQFSIKQARAFLAVDEVPR